jgi:hypothetical protein
MQGDLGETTQLPAIRIYNSGIRGVVVAKSKDEARQFKQFPTNTQHQRVLSIAI